VQKEVARRSNPMYMTQAKVFNLQIAKEVYERAMEAPITITQRELLSLAPKVCAQIADITIKKHIPHEPVVQAMIEEVTDEDEPTPKRSTTEKHNEHMPVAYVLATHTPPADTLILPDPYETYLRDGPPTTADADFDVVTAPESNTLRAITPVINGQEKVEAILDPRCQVVAMLEEISLTLAIPYDLTVQLSMMSANGEVDKTLGIAHNVPFLVGDIILYMQVHILRAPAYDILLGRPFNVLTKLVICNYLDENQTVTIRDPNTGHMATVPTIPHGSFRFANRRRPSNRCSMHP